MIAVRIVCAATAVVALLSIPAASAAQDSRDDEKAETKIELSASPRHIFIGQPFTLSWYSQSLTDCTAEGDWTGPKPPSGSQTITPNAEGKPTYSLVCADSHSGRRVRGSARVRVETPSLSLTEIF